jgi:uncharacterized protein YndB with AHSA1/START domain
MTTIHLDRMLKATIDRVYDDWTRPELLSRWYGPNPDLELKVEADVRVGGETSSRWGRTWFAAPTPNWSIPG